MNNEIEQIAQQNDMSIEFVRWFFNEKKAACGEHWFLALGAMWEGWKAREGEATALALTLEKSREASGCPAGVDLQDWVKQLAAENVALKLKGKELLGEACAVYSRLNKLIDPSIGDFVDGQTLHEFQFVLEVETPATDRIVAGIKADVWMEAKDFTKSMLASDSVDHLDFLFDGKIQQLREGADK
ncbi:hypothetical protein [Klebsiella aerogenes]|uniref:hypothetical protein n=1 Tax=Klebsiella aerogenes TaxID=548 RepID=UPI0006995121|nr:hypothetical protein [Klebsiella aerogenes]EKZ9811580.1 hypothetical protein [Klebsiella aerogenes]VAE02018.1 Uncharacterised protein [Klebsiella aerogenes]HCL5636223.1 hypothetical protein [Klebsiella aerogenes]HED4170662.1 hypothetical protein [Klebsiella aerogenes]